MISGVGLSHAYPQVLLNLDVVCGLLTNKATNVFNLKIKDMAGEKTSKIAHLAKRYKDYILGNAYIPYQDLALYERAYEKWYMKDNNKQK